MGILNIRLGKKDSKMHDYTGWFLKYYCAILKIESSKNIHWATPVALIQGICCENKLFIS